MDTSLEKYILGLDLGTSSVGWALVFASPVYDGIVASGVRIFPEGVDRTKGEKSLNQGRTDARSLRRQGYRKVRRKEKLQNLLKSFGLMPSNDDELSELYRLNPYQLRAEGLHRLLTPFELGRAIYHLGQRRGYKSNRKTGKDKDDGKVGQSISAIQLAMKNGGYQTLGEYLFSLCPGDNVQAVTRIRGQYTSRSMYEQEFDALRSAQQRFGFRFLTEKQWVQTKEVIFFQRPLKIQKFLVGYCEFEPDRKRAHAATLAAQEFRLWQNLNHLRVTVGDEPERALSLEERDSLAEALSTKSQLTWGAVRKLLEFPEKSTVINLEKVRKSGLQGNQTAAAIIKCIKAKIWKALSARQQENLVFDLLNIHDDDALMRRLTGHWGYSEEVAEALLSASLPKGYLHLSHKAVRNITPYFREASSEGHGLTYDKACERAGYVHTKPANITNADQLAFPGKSASTDGQAMQLRNPMVERALYQVRRVVNDIIKEHGKPDIIRVEMARDLKMTPRQREESIKRQKQNEARNKEAEKRLIEYGISRPSRQDIIKYNLREECGHECPYTGQPINMNDLFGPHPRFDIEHIIPYSRCLDDSYMNKSLCDRNENARKGKLTPAELYERDEEKYKAVLQRAKKLPYQKFKRFSKVSVESLGEFVSQQLNETRYIAREAHKYLAQLGVPVESVKGGTTATLRRAWGLNNVLHNGEEKTRDDHRHHAIDAVVVALTDRKAVQGLSRYAEVSNGLRVSEYPEPMPNLRDKVVASVNEIVVSHKTQRGISGALHEDTIYGVTGETDKKGVLETVVRKPIASLNEKKLTAIRDPRIRELALEHLAHSKNFKDAFQNPDNPFGIPNKNGGITPVRKVRITEFRSVQAIGKPVEPNGKPRHMWTRNNHHMEILERTVNGKRQLQWVMVSMLEAATRLRLKQPIIKSDHDDGWQLHMALHKNDSVIVIENGVEQICRVNALSQGEIELRRNTDARKSKEGRIRIKSLGKLEQSQIRVVSVSPAGRLLT